MALSTLRTNFSGLFKTKGTRVAETPQFYLKLTNICMMQADSMVASTSLKFNHEQCKYLAHKLKVAGRSAFSFFKPLDSWYSKVASDEDRGRFLEIFKMLFALSKEVEAFIQGCSKDAWVQSAVLLRNVFEHRVASLGFDLEFCTTIFSNRKKFGSLPPLMAAEISRLRSVESGIVKEKSHLDQVGLGRDLRAQLMQSKNSGSADLQQVTLLLEKLGGLRVHPSADSSESTQSCLEISMSSLKQIQVLATGDYGDVHKVQWLGMEVVRKTFHGPCAEYFEREVQILAGLCHPNIVSLLWYMRDERKCFMIMELMDGDLYSLIQERVEGCRNGDPPFSISEAVHIMLQVAEGVLFLHEKRIVHRDLKSRNILVNHTKATTTGVKYVHAKVADFGLSKTKEKSVTYSNQTQNQGTTRWMAPEMMKTMKDDEHGELQGEEAQLSFPFKADVYSFAMVCLEILTGDVPYPTLTAKEVKMKVLGGERPQIPVQCPDRLRCLIEACWSSMPNERPCFNDICVELRDLKCAHYMTAAWIPATYWFSLEEIKKMTSEFSEDNCIRSKGFSQVYKGVMADTGEVVAVERFRSDFARENSELGMLVTEVFPRLRHDNVVGFAGYSMEEGKIISVFENASLNASLDEWIFEDARKVNMTWPVRQNICLGVAKGIRYLHSLSQPRIVHRAIQLSNIWLDKNLEPKVGGFELVVELPGDNGLGFLAGICGYTAPEYIIHGKLSQKADVYSFGIVLLEIMSGRRAVDIHQPENQNIFVLYWARRLLAEGEIKKLIDPSLDLEPDEVTEVIRIITIALLCVHDSPETRPDMGLVVEMLQGILDAANANKNMRSDGDRLENEQPDMLSVFAPEGPSNRLLVTPETSFESLSPVRVKQNLAL